MSFRRISWIAGVAGLVAGLFVAELNMIDYQQFQGAIDRAERLSSGDCMAMADFCRRVRKEREYGAVEAPPPFRVLDPRELRVTPGAAEVVLHELGPSRITLWVESVGEQQRVRYTVHARPARVGRVLWTRLPEPAASTVAVPRRDGAEAKLPLPWWCLWRRWAE